MSYPVITVPKTSSKKKNQGSAREAVIALTPKATSSIRSLNSLDSYEVEEFEVKDYQGIISKASIENELVDNGYNLLNRVIVSTHSGPKAKYIKTNNKQGQIVFVLLDVEGYTTTRETDLTLSECEKNTIPHSVKSGVCDCAGNDVFGVALEAGCDTLCVISRDEDLKIRESSFTFDQQKNESSQGDIISYPIVRMSEVRTTPDVVLSSTDKVTRRLRNSIFSSLVSELSEEEKSVEKLEETVKHFNKLKDDIATKLNKTLSQLEEWNKIYNATPPLTDEGKERYRKLQYNLSQRNVGIAVLLQGMKKVEEHKKDIDRITMQIREISKVFEKDFADVEYVLEE